MSFAWRFNSLGDEEMGCEVLPVILCEKSSRTVLVESASSLVERRDEVACIAVTSAVRDAVVGVCCAAAACCIGCHVTAKIAMAAVIAHVSRT